MHFSIKYRIFYYIFHIAYVQKDTTITRMSSYFNKFGRSSHHSDIEDDIPHHADDLRHFKQRLRFFAVIAIWIMVWFPSNILVAVFYSKQPDVFFPASDGSPTANLSFNEYEFEDMEMPSYFSNLKEKARQTSTVILCTRFTI